jgi:hypothetical protein
MVTVDVVCEKMRTLMVILVAAACIGYVLGAQAWIYQPTNVMVSGFGGITAERVYLTIEKKYPFALVDPRTLENLGPDYVLGLWQVHEMRARIWVALAIPCAVIFVMALVNTIRKTYNRMAGD